MCNCGVRPENNKSMTKTIIFNFLLLFLFTSCGTNKPAKIKGIPETAFWAGGVDGGQWYQVDSIDKQNNTIVCKIYNDNNGELVANRKFKLHCFQSKSDINWDNLEDEINSYDGTRYISLKTLDSDNKHCWFE
jgi:hypothetical protein